MENVLIQSFGYQFYFKIVLPFICIFILRNIQLFKFIRILHHIISLACLGTTSPTFQ